jgi:hypothetical protein
MSSKAFTPDLTRAGHPRLFDRRFPRVALARSPSRLDGTDAATATSQIRPVSLDAMRTMAAAGGPTDSEHTNRAGNLLANGGQRPSLGKAGPAGPA